ncbi:protein phosphatase 2C domain-containing protein [Phycicoccus sp. MAQZ13P-2]|uniref:PP2C family protein-serine/threonine phosphatase n=1 Tax=Phycicoccus mangrovi TaxID=2840470 RepID=UPI001C007212|nr:protein phosphatase 2C domain-containing protein [Phycicoccus mangrovi]MBT9258033.1 protein phosphatase 2C domain-containing protein [Phycicoccus mangrovi]MBT9276017.1 protein phosphatase 2C domain-containing protein [Phycicoccus mangrovi]
MAPTRVVAVGRASDTGAVRRLNEDAVHCGERLFVVADGMGGHAAGDVASALTVEVLAELETGVLSGRSVREAVRRANDRVCAHAREHPAAAGLGTTVAGIALLDGERSYWAVFHVGDSRVYAVREGVLHRVTADHSEVQELLDAGSITEEEARVHPARHVITRAVGEEPAPEVDLVLVPADTGTRWVLCTDGLTDELADPDLAAVLAAGHPAQMTADLLVRRALEQGGHDNVTVVVVDEASTAADRPLVGSTNPRSRP